MANQPSGSAPADAARDQLRDARRAHDASLGRALAPAWLILALSVFCGALTVAPRYKGPGHVLSIVAVVLLIAALFGMSARNQWDGLRAMPKPKWSVAEATLIAVAVLVGGVVGPHVLVGRAGSAVVSWGFGAAVTVAVAIFLFVANASYRHRASRTWQR